jgi:arylsulfatase A-like enzyme
VKSWFFFFAVLFCLGVHAATIEPQKPDILLLMPDQMRGDCLSLVGHPVVRTPHLDELARQGALFRRAYATCPSCIPSRYSLLTGMSPTASGVVGYAAPPIVYPTLPKVLAEAGYTTVLVGRYMHQVPKDDSYGYQKEIRGSTYVANDDYDTFLRKAAPETGGIRALVNKLGVTFNGWQAKPWPLAEELHPTVWIAGQARMVVKEAPPEKPLFLTVSFYAPHPPLFPPRRYFDYYQQQKLPPVAHGDWVDWKSLSPEGNRTGDRILLEGEVLRATQSGYFGLIEQLDDQLAPVIADFKERSRRAKRPWIIMFFADHGEMLGDNGYFRKCEPYEGSANIPFLVAGSPELNFTGGLRSFQPVCLEDVMPTLLEVAGQKRPANVDGISLVPVLRGESHKTRDILHSEHAPCYNQPQAFQALTDGRYKYIWRTFNGIEQLFDLDKDMHEEHNLAKVDSQRALLLQWRGRLIQTLLNRPEGFTDGTNLIPGRPYPALQTKARSKQAAKAGNDRD